MKALKSKPIYYHDGRVITQGDIGNSGDTILDFKMPLVVFRRYVRKSPRPFPNEHWKPREETGLG